MRPRLPATLCVCARAKVPHTHTYTLDVVPEFYVNCKDEKNMLLCCCDYSHLLHPTLDSERVGRQGEAEKGWKRGTANREERIMGNGGEGMGDGAKEEEEQED